MIITVKHLQMMGYCQVGAARFCERYGLDYWRFVKQGIDERILLAACPNDQMVLDLLEVAHGRRR